MKSFYFINLWLISEFFYFINLGLGHVPIDILHYFSDEANVRKYLLVRDQQNTLFIITNIKQKINEIKYIFLICE